MSVDPYPQSTFSQSVAGVLIEGIARRSTLVAFGTQDPNCPRKIAMSMSFYPLPMERNISNTLNLA